MIIIAKDRKAQFHSAEKSDEGMAFKI